MRTLRMVAAAAVVGGLYALGAVLTYRYLSAPDAGASSSRRPASRSPRCSSPLAGRGGCGSSPWASRSSPSTSRTDRPCSWPSASRSRTSSNRSSARPPCARGRPIRRRGRAFPHPVHPRRRAARSARRRADRCRGRHDLEFRLELLDHRARMVARRCGRGARRRNPGARVHSPRLLPDAGARLLESIAVAMLAVCITVIPAVYLHESSAYAVLPVLLFAAIRGGPFGVGIVGLGVGFSASWVAASGNATALLAVHGTEGALDRHPAVHRDHDPHRAHPCGRDRRTRARRAGARTHGDEPRAGRAVRDAGCGERTAPNRA